MTTAKKEGLPAITAEKARTKTKHAKTRCTIVLPRKRFVRPLHGPCPAPSAVHSNGSGSIQTARQVFRLWRQCAALSSHTHRYSDINGPNSAITAAVPRRSCTCFPILPASESPGHPVLLCGYYGTINPAFWQAKRSEKAGLPHTPSGSPPFSVIFCLYSLRPRRIPAGTHMCFRPSVRGRSESADGQTIVSPPGP